MNIITKDDLIALSGEQKKLAVSIYLPTERLGQDTKQNPIRFKNLLNQVEERLQGKNVRAVEIQKLLQPARDLIEDYQFWQYQSDGLAVFIGQDEMKAYRLPLNFAQMVNINTYFYLKPLMPMLSGNGDFYILAISQGKIWMLHGTRDSVDDIDLTGVPANIQEALMWDDPEKQLQWHTQTTNPASSTERPAMFHGHGVGTDDQKDNLLRYFQKVDESLQGLLQDRYLPMILAGVDYLLPLYRQASSYPNILEQEITGSPKVWSADYLHEKAWEIMEPLFNRQFEDDVNRYRAFAGNNTQATNDLKEIVSGAFFGRVDTLFVADEMQQWGDFDHETNTVQILNQGETGARDLLDFAAVHTIINGGRVYVIEPEQIPASGLAAAILRY
jgi:hypothetical protein